MSIRSSRRRSLRALLLLLCMTIATAVSAVAQAPPALAGGTPVIQASATLNKPLLNPVRLPDRFDGANYVFWQASVTFDFRITGLGRNSGTRVVAVHGPVTVQTLAVCNGFTAALSVAVQKPAQFRSDGGGVIRGSIVMRDAYALTAIDRPFSPTCGMVLSVTYQDLQLRAGGVVKNLGSLSRTYTYGFR